MTIVSADGTSDLSNYRIQYACGQACGGGSSSTASTTNTPAGETPPGGGGGDPHIDTMKGDHYTLIKQGNFLAFSLKGKEALVAAPHGSGIHGASRVPVDFELFAHYNNGRKSFTRGLLLLDHQNHQAIEMTSEDCRWRVRAGPVTESSPLIPFVFGGKLRERMGMSGFATILTTRFESA